MSLRGTEKVLVLRPAIRRGQLLQSGLNSYNNPNNHQLSSLSSSSPSSSSPSSPSQFQSLHARRALHTTTRCLAPPSTGGFVGPVPPSYFQRPSLPANTIIRFVPQQTAWIVERMGKFNRILEPGLAILVPFLDRIAYVRSLKEVAIEIPSQSAITADNVTLELDGVLYTRVFDAYKAR